MAPFRKSAPDNAPNAIVGAAHRVNLQRKEEIQQMRVRSTAEWQELAWRYYDEIGEIKFGFNYFAAVASRVRMYVGYQDDASESPSPIGSVGDLDRNLVNAARAEFKKLSTGRGGQPNLIRLLVLNMLVAGEVFLVGTDGSWAARSTSELHFEDNNRVRLNLSRVQTSGSRHYLPDDAFVARIWRTHPQYSDDADSSLNGLRKDCSELLLLSRIIRASGQSRLNAGLLYVADELRFQRSSDLASGDPAAPDVDAFEEELTLALTEPIGMTDSPSEIVPMIIRGPAELAATGITKIDLSRSFDETTIARHDQTLQRILNSLDFPKDIVTGMADAKFANAKNISEDMLKAHVEPMLVLLCEALTTVFLRPMLIARGYDPDVIDNVQVWYDPSEVVTRPDRSEDADKGYERMLVSAATWRRSHGFSETDAPDQDEITRRIALAGSIAPSTTLDFLRELAPELVKKAEDLANESYGPAPSDSAPPESPPTAEVPPPSVPAPQNPAKIATPSSSGTQPIAPANNPPNGELPPRSDAATASVSTEQGEIDAVVMEVIRSIVAAAPKQPSKVVRDRTRRMELALEVERRLRESLFTHLNDVVQRSLERGGARTVSKVRGDLALKTLVMAVDLEAAYAQIPSDRRAEFGLDAPKLVLDTIEKAKTAYVKMMTAGQLQGWNALDDTGALAKKLKPTQSQQIEASWTWIAARLLASAVSWITNPKKTGQFVNMGTVRGAQAIAGGGSVESRDENPEIVYEGPSDLGRAILSSQALAATEWDFEDGYRWIYGISEDSFIPHLKLDGTTFDTWEAKELRNKKIPNKKLWPPTPFYFPGDHVGCRCDFLPIALDPAAVNEQKRGKTWSDPQEDMPLAASLAAPIVN